MRVERPEMATSQSTEELLVEHISLVTGKRRRTDSVARSGDVDVSERSKRQAEDDREQRSTRLVDYGQNVLVDNIFLGITTYHKRICLGHNQSQQERSLYEIPHKHRIDQ